MHVASVRSASLTEPLIAYGAVVPAPGSVRAFNAPFEAVVGRLHITRGQRVTAGQPLMDVVPSPEARLLIESARSALRLARGRMVDAQARLELGLITRDEVLLQEQLQADAEAKWATYSQWRDGLKLAAVAGGVVDRMPVSEGQRIPAGDLLVSVVSEGRFEVALGLEPEDAALVKQGQELSIEQLGGAAPAHPIVATVRSVSLAVDSATRLISALAVPRAGTNRLLLGEFVRAVIPVRSGVGLVVPRSAILQQEGRTVVFVVRGRVALQRFVTVGLETDSLVQVTSPDVHEADSVVVLGNYELADSMRVRLPGDSTSAPIPRSTVPARGGR
ncbi:MAG: efflux RND transporter periplasmic adaptor subunit [Gemmatimonadota bacterium]